MNTSIVIAYFHLLTLGIGFYAIWARATALKKLVDATGLSDVFRADNLWGLAAALWIITGVWRAFGGLEKGTDYYLHSTAFIIKMCLFLLIFLLEIQPMITLIRWRKYQKNEQLINYSKSKVFALLSHVQLGLLALIILFAITMARGIWF